MGSSLARMFKILTVLNSMKGIMFRGGSISGFHPITPPIRWPLMMQGVRHHDGSTGMTDLMLHAVRVRLGTLMRTMHRRLHECMSIVWVALLAHDLTNYYMMRWTSWVGGWGCIATVRYTCYFSVHDNMFTAVAVAHRITTFVYMYTTT